MPFEPLRFVHACGLCVDHQLHELPPLADGDRGRVEDATATAFERIVSASIEHRVDFLLLAGDSFCADDCSLRAEVLFRRGFEQLAEHNIRVFLVPGTADPARAWQAIRDLPDNVTSLDETSDAPVAVIRDGKVIASICSLDVGTLRGVWAKRETNTPKPESQRGPLNIGIMVVNEISSAIEATRIADVAPILADCGLDYLAFGGSAERQTIAMKAGLAHHPGGTQSIRATENGPRGCTLIDVDQAGVVHSSFIPTAAVRRERIEIVVDEETDEPQLANRIRQALEERKPEPGESLWLVEWIIRGKGPLVERLSDETHRHVFLQQAETTVVGDVRVIHTCRLVPDKKTPSTAANGEAMLAEFLAAVGGTDAETREKLVACFAEHAPANMAWLHALEPLMQGMDVESVLAETQRLGSRWFAPAASEDFAA